MIKTMILYMSKGYLVPRTSDQLPTKLLHAAVGQLLGDAYADKSSASSNTRLSWSFGTNYSRYAQFVYNLFNEYCNKGIYNVNVVAKKDGVSYVNYRLKTKTLAIFNQLHTMFYITDPLTGKKVKIVPLQIDNFMSPITLAHLIMCDGGYHKGQNIVRIFTYNFTLADCERLAQSITKLGIKTTVVLDRTNNKGVKQYILKINSDQLDRLRNMVIPHMEESMLYRVGYSK